MVDFFVGVGPAAKVVGPDIVIDLPDLPLTQCGFLFELLKNTHLSGQAALMITATR